MAVYKNKSNQKIPIYASDADGNPATGIASTITGRISLDGGTPQTLTNSQPSELSSSLAPGVYIFTLTSNETNCDMFVVSASSSQSGVDIKPVAAFTEPEIRQADIQAIASHTQSAANLKAACDGTTGFNLGNGQIVAASVTGNVGGSVNSVTSAVTVGAMNANTITSTVIQDNAITSSKIASDAKQSIASFVWNALTTVVTEAQSLGKWILDRLNDTITSRLAASSYTAPDNASISAIKAKTDNLPSNPASQTKLDDIHSMMEFQSGTPGYWRYRSSALETTPSGSGGATPEEIWSYTGGSGRTLTGAVTVGAMNSNVITASAIQDGAITAAKIASDAIQASKIQDGAITANKLASGAITAAKFATDAITDTVLASSAATEISAAVWDRLTANITTPNSIGKRVVDNLDATVSSRSTFNPSSQTVTVGAMNANTITSTAIQDGAIVASKIAADAIQASKIQDGAITAAKIASGAITSTKLATNAITADNISSDAIAKIQSGLATDGNLTTVEVMVGSVQSDLDTLRGKFDEIDEDVYEKVGTPAYRRLRKRALEEAPKGYKTW